MIKERCRNALVIGLGGNVGTTPAIVERFTRARAALGAIGRVRQAPLYRSAPIGPAQPAFLNTAVAIEVAELDVDQLMKTLLELEWLLGRDRANEVRWGPRRIDLDVLAWGDRVIRTATLEVPHPRLAERRFALAPLGALLGNDFEIPGAGRVGGLLAGVAAQDCVELSIDW
ncbi:MAG TPA: 2-amino-4-hydroxy-6-hydroxymethyldihydropteridine diphosphokinase [Kofleriaceae bacterium]|nr:2-amino-4-hydroxy-6-hydroxymethyldihydropteridine diphosphokinase [Kofleriaceae bacterium]